MSWYNWLIVIIPFLFVIGMAFYSRRYIRDVVDTLSAERVCERYVISETGLKGTFGLNYIPWNGNVYELFCKNGEDRGIGDIMADVPKK